MLEGACGGADTASAAAGAKPIESAASCGAASCVAGWRDAESGMRGSIMWAWPLCREHRGGSPLTLGKASKASPWAGRRSVAIPTPPSAAPKSRQNSRSIGEPARYGTLVASSGFLSQVARLWADFTLRSAMLGTILLIILILLLIGALPHWGYSGGWGYYPSGGVGLLLVIVIILLLFGRI